MKISKVGFFDDLRIKARCFLMASTRVNYLLNFIANYLWLRAIREHKSRMGRILAPKYTSYLNKAKAIYKQCDSLQLPEINSSAINYNVKGFASYQSFQTRAIAKSMLSKVIFEELEFGETSIWGEDLRYLRGDIFQKFPEVAQLLQGEVGALIERIFGSYFKVYYGVMYKSVDTGKPPIGSQLWHSDGGPGTCINLMFCLSETHEKNGAMEFIPWEASLEIFSKERNALLSIKNSQNGLKIDARDLRSKYYEDIIFRKFLHRKERLVGDEGLVLAFRNNLIHKGGYCDPGHIRYACIFHLYPSLQATPWEQYEKFGIPKMGGYPSNPDF